MNDNDHYLVVDVPNNCEKIKDIIQETCGNLSSNEKINEFFKKCKNHFAENNQCNNEAFNDNKNEDEITIKKFKKINKRKTFKKCNQKYNTINELIEN